jgi:hypothetical protein
MQLSTLILTAFALCATQVVAAPDPMMMMPMMPKKGGNNDNCDPKTVTSTVVKVKTVTVHDDPETVTKFKPTTVFDTRTKYVTVTSTPENCKGNDPDRCKGKKCKNN